MVLFKSWPLLSTMTTYGVMWTASDIVQELVISKKDHLDMGKTARIGITGALVNAPLVYSWLQLLEMYLPGNKTRTVTIKVILDQVVFAPVALSAFFLTTSALEGKNGIPELKAKFMTAYLGGMLYWPVAQVLNFRFVPHRYKPLGVACASFVWTMFLCYMKEKEVPNVVRVPSVYQKQEEVEYEM